MNMPGFDAESSLGPATGRYRARAPSGGAGVGAVLPMLDDDLCGNCETVGTFGGIHGVGRRSCCRKSWRYDPITKRYEPSWSCWFESCTAEATRNRWLSFD